MSSETEAVDGEAREAESVLGLVEDWYQVPVLGVLIAFMFWVRIQARDAFTVGGDIYFRGNDAYYHFREVSYTVRHWPSTMPFDPWTHFPFGNASGGQFGSLFDQLIATAALIVGLGNPSDHTVRMVMLYAAPVFGTLAAVPVYFVGKRVGGRASGLFAVFVLALLPGEFLRRGTVGFADHQIAEVFFHSLAAFGVISAVVVVQRTKPVFEQLQDRDWDALRKPLLWSAFAGFTINLYMWTWPPGLIMLAIAGIFFLLAMCLNYVRGRTPEHLAIGAAVMYGTNGLLSLVTISTFQFGPNRISLLHVTAALGVAVGAAFMAWLARTWDERGFDPVGYPVVVAGVIGVGALVVWVALPGAFDTIVTNFSKTFIPGQTSVVGTVGEAQSLPWDAVPDEFFRQYGMLYLTGLVGVVWMLGRIVSSRDYDAVLLFLVVWTVLVTLMAVTQRRFNYYLAIALVSVNAWLFAQVYEMLSLPTAAEKVGDVRGYQVLTVLAVLMLVAVPLLPPLASANVVDAGDQTGPGSSVVWSQGANWMEDNTPAEGQYAGANNDLAYYGTFQPQDDFAYPEGAYGVMSWWDYGHWITVQGERIPNANPFQQGPRSASSYLQAQNEDRANTILEALPNLDGKEGQIDEMSTAQIQAYADNASAQQQGEDTRYVMIDDQMAGEKFGPITRWATPPGTTTRGYYTTAQYNVTSSQGTQPVPFVVPTQQYYDTQLAKLYLDDASGLAHYRLVHEVNSYSLVGSYLSTTSGRRLERIKYQVGPWRQQLANVSAQLSRTDRPIPISRTEYMAHADVESRVKTFERVSGATIEGSVDVENRTGVLARVRLQVQNTGRTFMYTQRTTTDAQGNFNVTVPYATTDLVGVDEGATNESVVATTGYSVRAGAVGSFLGQTVVFQPVAAGTVNVSESAVLNGDSVDIEMNAVEQNSTNGTNGTTGGNETGGSNTTSIATPNEFASGSDGASASGTTSGGAASPLVAAEPRVAPID